MDEIELNDLDNHEEEKKRTKQTLAVVMLKIIWICYQVKENYQYSVIRNLLQSCFYSMIHFH